METVRGMFAQRWNLHMTTPAISNKYATDRRLFFSTVKQAYNILPKEKLNSVIYRKIVEMNMFLAVKFLRQLRGSTV